MALQSCCAEGGDREYPFGNIMDACETKYTAGHLHDDDDDDLEDCDLSCFLEDTLFASDEPEDTASLSVPKAPLVHPPVVPASILSKFPPPYAEEPPLPSKRSPSSCSSPVSHTKKQGVNSISSGSRGKATTLSARSAEEEDATAVHPSGNVRCPHSCRKCYNDCMNKLMALCDTQEIMNFSTALRPPYKGSKLRKSGETVDSESYMVDAGSKAPTALDTVVQLFSIDMHSVSRVYCSVFSSRKLSDLHMGLTNKCYGFRTIRRIVFVDDTLPENFCKAYDEYALSHSRCYQPHPDMRPKEQHYLMVESDYCGPTVLHSKLKPAQAISIIGQVACTLAVAERELQFEHRNLLEENIKVLPSTNKNHHFLIDGRTCCVKGSGIKVTLVDDNFGRMTYNNEIILRMRNYNCVYKDKTAQYLTLERIIKNRWDLFHPETNALWLAYLCGHLSDYLTVPNPSGEWQRRLELLAFMQRDLHRVHSAEEFVWSYINKIGHVHADHGYQPHSWGNRNASGQPLYTGLLSLLRWRDKKKSEDENPPGPSASPRAPRGGSSSAPAELDRQRPR